MDYVCITVPQQPACEWDAKIDPNWILAGASSCHPWQEFIYSTEHKAEDVTSTGQNPTCCGLVQERSHMMAFDGRQPAVPHSSSAEVGHLYNTMTRSHSSLSRLPVGSDSSGEASTWSVEELFVEAIQREVKYHPTYFMEEQPEVTMEMRSILVHWLSQVSQRFEFCSETLFLTVNIIDRFLGTTPVSRDCLQLLGITSLFIAAKQRLRFGLMVVTPAFFLDLYATWWKSCLVTSGIDTDTHRELVETCHRVAESVLQECLQDYSLSQYPPSIASLAALCVAWNHLVYTLYPGQDVSWGPSSVIQGCVELCSMVGFSQQGIATIFNLCVSELAMRQDILYVISLEFNNKSS